MDFATDSSDAMASASSFARACTWRNGSATAHTRQNAIAQAAGASAEYSGCERAIHAAAATGKAKRKRLPATMRCRQVRRSIGRTLGSFRGEPPHAARLLHRSQPFYVET